MVKRVVVHVRCICACTNQQQNMAKAKTGERERERERKRKDAAGFCLDVSSELCAGTASAPRTIVLSVRL